MDRNELKKHKLTVYLIKDSYLQIEEFVQSQGYQSIEITRDNGEFYGRLYYKATISVIPEWCKLFEHIPGFRIQQLASKSARGLFVLPHRGRFFCFTFGHARGLIDPFAFERNFGLKIAINLADPESVKSIDKTSIGPISLHSREQSTRDVDIDSFDFDIDSSLLKAIAVKTPENEFGLGEILVAGRDSLSTRLAVDISEFEHIAEKLLSTYESDRYREYFYWIDYIQEERDKSIITELDRAMIEQIIERDFTRVWMSIPDIVDWEEISGFAYKKASQRPNAPGPVMYGDIEIENWIEYGRIDESLSVEILKRKRIYQHFSDGRAPIQLSAYHCLNSEIDHDDEKYILNDGSWYRLESSFVEEVDDFYHSIPAPPYTLPNFGADNEPAYLIKVANDHSDHYALMDRKNIYIGGGRSQIEFCDLYAKSGDMIHVKKYGGSSVLSHLFAQGQVSAELFRSDSGFRTAVNEKLPDDYKFDDPAAEPQPVNHPVCYAVMSKHLGALELPFFSKVNLRSSIRQLRTMGFPVYKLKIDR